MEVNGYNAATVEKIISKHKKYFIVFDNKEIEVKLNKKSFIAALPNFKDKIEAYFSDFPSKPNDQNFIA